MFKWFLKNTSKHSPFEHRKGDKIEQKYNLEQKE